MIGWSVASGNDAGAPYRDAVALALAKLFTETEDLHVSADCEPADVPARIRGQVETTGRDERAAVDLGVWFVQLFTPALVDGETADDVLPFTEASQAAVPTIMPVAARTAIDGFVSSALLVDDPHNPEHWSAALHHALESIGRRTQLSSEVRQRADAVNAPTTSKVMMNRILGWARDERIA